MKMGKLGCGIAAIFAGLGLAGCPGAPVLFVTDTYHNFGSTGESFQFEVYNADNSGSRLYFYAYPDKDWLFVSYDSESSYGPLDPQIVTVTIDRNAKAVAQDLGSATITVGGSGGTAIVRIDASPEYFTEEFDGDFDIDFSTVTFAVNDSDAPDPSLDFYRESIADAAEFPVDPTGGFVMGFSITDPVAIPLNNIPDVPFYGEEFGVVYIGSEGYVAFEPVAKANQSLTSHFDLPRISALATDLDPAAGGTVTYRQNSGGISVTYENVPERGTVNSNTFQIAIGFDGTIRLTYLGVDAPAAIVGLSTGNGVPVDFTESNFLTFPVYQSGNDNFADRLPFVTVAGSTYALNGEATRETNEPYHAYFPSRKSMWWTFTAPAAGTMEIDTSGSNFLNVLAVYTGSNVGALTRVAYSYDGTYFGGTSAVTFATVSGTFYQIVVDADYGEFGEIQLNWEYTPNAPLLASDGGAAE